MRSESRSTLTQLQVEAAAASSCAVVLPEGDRKDDGPQCIAPTARSCNPAGSDRKIVEEDLQQNLAKISPLGTAPAVSPHKNIGLRPECFTSTTQEIICIVILTFAAGSSSISQGIIQVTTKEVGEALHMNAGAVTWINAAQVLTTSAFILFAGSLADILGRKRLLLGSLVLFAIFTAIAGAATNAIWFNTMRGVQGLMIAAALPSSAGIIGFSYNGQSVRKNRAFACFSAGNPLGFSLGTISAGIATKILSWRAGLYFWAIVFGIFSIVAYFVVPQDGPRDKSRRLDPLGALLIVAGLAGIIASLTLGSEAPHGWKTPYILVLLVLGVLLCAAFLYWQTSRLNKQPLMPLSIFKSRTYSLLILSISTGFAGFSSSLFWVALLMQIVRGYSTLSTAVHLLPATVSGAVVNYWAALLLHRVNNTLLLLAGCCGYLAGNLLFSFAAFPNTSYWAFIFTGQIFLVYGADFQFCIANMYILSNSSKENQSLASGVFSTTCQIGVAIGLALSSAAFQAINGADIFDTSGDDIQPKTYRAYRAAFYLCLAFSAIGFLTLPFMHIGKQGNATAPDGEKELDNLTEDAK